MIDKLFSGVTIFFLAFLAFGVGILLHADSDNIRTISLDSVTGVAKSVPDHATISLAIRAETTESKEVAATAFSQANKKLTELFAKYAIDHADIHLENIYTNEWKTEVTNDEGYKYETTAHVMGQDLRIVLSDGKFEKFSDIMKDLSVLKNISVYGVEKWVKNTEKLLDLARENAIEKAKNQAEATAKNLGMKLGKVISVEVVSAKNGFYNVPLMAKTTESDSDVISGLQSEDEYSVELKIQYEIH